MTNSKISFKNKLNQKNNTFEILRENYIYFLAVIRFFFRNKNFLKHFGFIYGLYFIGIFGLLIADVYHRDDIWRMQGGNPSFLQASRRLSQVLSYFFHASYPKIADISPISQLIAIAFLSIASIALVKTVNKKITYTGLTASLLLGLNPWYLQCLSYKYDSVFMALATLCAVFPFLFTKRLSLFFFTSVFFLVCMWNLYQTNNGIYIVIAFFLVINFIVLKTNAKQILRFLLVSMFAFILAGLIYKFFFFIEPKADSYIGKLNSVDISKFFENIKKLLHWTNRNIGTNIIKYLFFISMLFFGFAMFQKRKNNPVITILAILIFLFIGLFASYGMYLILAKFDQQARAISQIGGFLAIVAIVAVSQKQKILNFISKTIVIYMSYCLITISNSYANALDMQEKFHQYRINLLMSDLENLLPINKNEKINISVNTLRPSDPTMNIYKQVLPMFFHLTNQITEFNIYLLRAKGLNVLSKANNCAKGKKLVNTFENRFHKIEIFENNCYSIEFK